MSEGRLVFLGDIHGDFAFLRHVVDRLEGDEVLIQVGDFGFWPQLQRTWIKPSRPVYFIEGNHEHHPSLAGLTRPSDVWDGAIYMPRGTVAELASYHIGFCGGASSVDKATRTPGYDWFPEENVTAEDIGKLWGEHVDLLVTHTPPREVVERHFDPAVLEYAFGLSRDYVCPSQVLVQSLWDHLGRPPLVCGHMHQSIHVGDVHILDTKEVFPWRGARTSSERGPSERGP